MLYSLPYLVRAILEEKIVASTAIHHPWGTLYKLLWWWPSPQIHFCLATLSSVLSPCFSAGSLPQSEEFKEIWTLKEIQTCIAKIQNRCLRNIQITVWQAAHREAGTVILCSWCHTKLNVARWKCIWEQGYHQSSLYKVPQGWWMTMEAAIFSSNIATTR